MYLIGGDGGPLDAMRARVRALLLVVTILFVPTAPSWAVLGESLGSLASDQQRLNGELRSSAREGFSVHEITAAGGTVVRQYASPSGVVFGVSWHGPYVPDLAQLLGSYFPDFQQAVRSAAGPTARRRGPLAVRTDRLVVETGGHVRSLHGRVYLPAALPTAVSERVVQ